MKIERVESLLLGGADGSAGQHHIVRIHTDSGLSGIGQSACWAYLEAAHEIVQKCAEYLVGQDPSRIEHHWQYMYRMGPFRGSALSGAISAIDIALWDIKGKRLQAPIWDLLGGNTRDKIRLHLLMGPKAKSELPYAHDRGAQAEGLYQAAKDSVAEGFTAIKTDPLPNGFQSMTLERLISDTVDNVAAMREGGGKDVDLILEIHRKLTPMNAIALAQELEQFHPLFYEDPIQIDSMVLQGGIAQRTSLPLANGERIHNIWEFRDMFEGGGPQYVRPDMGLGGGITHVKKIAALAESYHSALCTHNFLGPVLTAAAVHVDASIPNFVTQEYSQRDEHPTNAVFKNRLKREGGYIMLPDRPGLGLELDEDRLETAIASYETRDLQMVPMRDDGSVGYSV